MKHLINSFKFAYNGVRLSLKNQRNIKIQIVIALIVIALSFFLKFEIYKIAIIIFLSFVIISLEMFNTAIENLIDILSPEYNKKYGNIKDILAGVVLAMSICSVIIGIMFFYNPISDLITKYI